MRKLTIQNLLKKMTVTHQGAQAYDWRDQAPLVHLVFTYGSALFVDGFYENEPKQVSRFAEALLAAHKVDAKFVWQYAAWMREPLKGKGNRIQGSLVPALLDGLLGETEHTEAYVEQCLRWRADDAVAFFGHYFGLGLGRPSAAACRGVARALTHFDEYQLMKYAAQKQAVRLCDVIAMVRTSLEAIGSPEAERVLTVGRYLHSSSRVRREVAAQLPLTSARRKLFGRKKTFASDPAFPAAVAQARVTWEQVLGHFGEGGEEPSPQAQSHNRKLWKAMLETQGLLPDMAMLRNLRNMQQAGFTTQQLGAYIEPRSFDKVWPHQVYAGYLAAPAAQPLFESIFSRTVAKLPPGRHLGIGDASGSMSVKVGGAFSSITCMDAAFCLVGLMSQSSGLGASFSDSTWFRWSSSYLSIAKRKPKQGMLEFATDSRIRKGMGGTQVFGAVLELIAYLRKNKDVEPPECLWFFSDMQFHPASGVTENDKLSKGLWAEARAHGMDRNTPPLELALKLYRQEIGPVDVVLWNLASYEGVPVPADMEGVLLVSGFDANTLDQVARWRQGELAAAPAAQGVMASQEVVLEAVRAF